MELTKLCLLLSSFAIFVEAGSQNNGTEIIVVKRKNHEARLIEDLLTQYRHRGAGLSRPIEDSSGCLNVTIKFVIHEYAGIQDVAKRMKMSGLLKATWKDAYLFWDPKKYGGLDVIPLRGDDIYLPVIVKQSSASEMTPIFARESGMSALIWVDYMGNVYATVAGAFRTDCHIDFTLFPFDTQSCDFVFQVWQHHERFVSLKVDPTEPFRLKIASSGDQAMWRIDSLQASNRLVELELANFSAVVYTITTTRRSTYYVWNLLIPCAMLSSVQLAAFFMPYKPERVMFAVTLVLSLHLFQDSVARQLPATAEPIPILKYTGSQMIIGILVVFESVMTIYVLERMGKVEVPEWLATLQMFFGHRVGQTGVEQDDAKPKSELRPIFRNSTLDGIDGKLEKTVSEGFPPSGIRVSRDEIKAKSMAQLEVKNALLDRSSAKANAKENHPQQAKIFWRDTILAVDKAIFVACFAATLAIPASVIAIF